MAPFASTTTFERLPAPVIALDVAVRTKETT